MNHSGKTRECATHAIVKCVALAISLWSTSGCYLTMKMWQVASRPVHRSKAVGAVQSPSGGRSVVLSLKRCKGREDGCYSWDVPSDWKAMPVKASPFGSDIVELAGAAPALKRAALPASRATRRLLALDFPKVLQAKTPPRWFDDRRDLGVVYDWSEKCFAAHIFGYDADNKRWVRLGEVPIDTPAVDEGSTAGAVLFTPVTVAFDAACWGIGALCCLGCGMQGGSAPQPPDPPTQPTEVKARMFVARLTDAGAGRERSRSDVLDAVHGLAGCGTYAKAAVPRLHALLGNSNSRVRLEAVKLLNRLCPKDRDSYLPALADLLRAAPEVRIDTVLEIGRYKLSGAFALLAEALRDDDASVRVVAISGLVGFQNAEASRRVAKALVDPDPRVRSRAAKALQGMDTSVTGDAVPALARALADTEKEVRLAVIGALKKIGGNKAVSGLADALDDVDREVRLDAIRAMRACGGKDAVPELARAVSNSDPYVRLEAANALGKMGPVASDAAKALRIALSDRSFRVRRSARQALASVAR